MGQTDNSDPRDGIRWINGIREVLWYVCPECGAYLDRATSMDNELEPNELVCCGICWHANYLGDLDIEWRNERNE